MPRRNQATKREVSIDAKYSSVLATRFIKRIMKQGKGSIAERIVYSALTFAERQESKPAINILEQAVKNATPLLEVKPRRVGGATYQVPVEIRPERAMSLCIRWLVKAAAARAGKSMSEKLAAELIDASKGQGAAIRRREDTHKMAEANRAFAHFRW